jgi:hypothetical protein
LFKSYSSGQINWNHFNKVDSIEGDFAAHIEAYISYRVNKVYNYTSATAAAKMEIDSSQYVSQSDNLLEHEYYHFKITEIVTRRLNKALGNYHFSNQFKTKELIHQYLDTNYLMQKDYDTETNHNLNADKQKEWKARIDKELEKE